MSDTIRTSEEAQNDQVAEPLDLAQPPQPFPFGATRNQPWDVAERRWWPWALAGLVALGILGFFGFRYWQDSQPVSLGLVVTERQGQLQVEWNSAARPIVRAVGGSLNIMDGSNVQRIGLSHAQLSEGRYMYTRQGSDVEVRLEIETGGDTIRESSRFLGRPPAPLTSEIPSAAKTPKQTQSFPPGPEPVISDAEKTALQDENKRLRLENATLKERIQQQERLRQILESRLGITGK
jgi:hypothetical protein